MATRSAIYNMHTGDLRYIHFDGYPEGVGATLKEHYSTPECVNALFVRAASSDMSSLGEDPTMCDWYDDEELVFPGTYDNAEAQAEYKLADCLYLYVWDGVRWSVQS